MLSDDKTGDVERLRAEAMAQARAEFEAEGEYGLASATIFKLDGNQVWLRFDVPDQEQRRAIQALCVKDAAWLVHHIMEVWVADAPLGDPVALAAHAAAADAGLLHLWPGRRERLVFCEEHLAGPIRRWAAEIERDEAGVPKLGEWTEQALKLPRPGFKRYLPSNPSAHPAARREGSYGA